MEEKKRLKKQVFSILNKKTLITESPDETVSLGMDFSRVLKSGDIVFLKGELGSGKTTFVKGVAKGLGIKKIVRSSSFILVSEYDYGVPTGMPVVPKSFPRPLPLLAFARKQGERKRRGTESLIHPRACDFGYSLQWSPAQRGTWFSNQRDKKGKMFHIDLYRLKGNNDLESLGLEEFLFSDGICFVEWADKIKKVTVQHGYEIDFKWLDDNKRKIIIKKRVKV
ncbi:MAG: tRNA (adenosine(37)-N6)-threonylcarbamoyltransferase complex ATPase subunit type 1 TsaE [Elusimicrobia bacterium]|nr:tRNA (adenosine(37)-N6)-threonylcarbamoyltransferase complex ATPase subunit type 1 TsaE [Elusimicrobiota bacterium]